MWNEFIPTGEDDNAPSHFDKIRKMYWAAKRLSVFFQMDFTPQCYVGLLWKSAER
jgi:hypothetical protein